MNLPWGISNRTLRSFLAALLVVTILVPVLHHESSKTSRDQDLTKSLLSSRHAFTRGGALRSLESALATPAPEFEPTEFADPIHPLSASSDPIRKDLAPLAAPVEWEGIGANATEHDGSIQLERPAPTHIGFGVSEINDGGAVQTGDGGDEVPALLPEAPDLSLNTDVEVGIRESAGTPPPTNTPSSSPTLPPTSAPSPAPTAAQVLHERALGTLYNGKTWPSLRELLTPEEALLPLAVNSEEYAQAVATASAAEQRRHAMSSGDERAVAAFTRALRTGATNDTWGGAALLESEVHEEWWAPALTSLVPGGNFSFIELGCFHQGSMLAAKIALRFPQASVLAVDVCGGGELGALLRVSEELVLRNLMVASLGGHSAKSVSAAIASLKAVLVEDELRCDFLAVTALSDLGQGLLPFELEALLANVLTLCGDTFLPDSLPDERFFSYWPDTLELIERSSSRIEAEYLVTASIVPEKEGHAVTSSSTSHTSSYTSRYGSATRPPPTTLWKVTTFSLLNETADALRPPAWSPRFLLAAGLVDTHRFVLAGRLAAAFGGGSPHSRDSLVVFGSSLVPYSKIAATVVSAAEAPRAEEEEEEGGAASAAAAAGAAATNSSAHLLPEGDESADADADPAKSSSRWRSYSSYRHTRRLLGILYDSHPAPEETAPHNRPGDAGVAEATQRPARRRIGDFLSSSEQRLQTLMLEEEEPPFFAAWESSLRGELESVDFASVLCLGSEMGLLGLKVAQAHPKAAVVSLRQSRAHGEAHVALLRLLKIRNNLPAANNLSLPLAAALLAPKDPFHVALLGESVVTHVLQQSLASSSSESNVECDWSAFERLYGSLLSLAKTSFVLLPRMSALSKALAHVLPQCSQSLTQRYTPTTATKAGSDTKEQEVQEEEAGHGTYGSPEELFLARCMAAAGHVSARVRRLRTSPAGSRLVLVRIQWEDQEEAEGGESAALDSGSSSLGAPLDGEATRGVSVYSLLHCGVLPSIKAELFRLFLELPLWRFSSLPAVVPWKLRFDTSESDVDGGQRVRLALLVNVGTREYGGAGGSQVAASVGGGGLAAEQSLKAAWWQTVRHELERSPAAHQNGRFSLLEYGSGGGALSMAVAQRFPNATVLSLESDGAAVAEHVSAVQRRGLWNNVVCEGHMDSSVTTKFVESPELLRYQVLSMSLLDLKPSSSGHPPSTYLSSLLSTGLTTFVHMPTDAHMSLAMEIFFFAAVDAPPAHTPFTPLPPSSTWGLLGPHYIPDRLSASAEYSLASHPRGAMVGLDVAFLQHQTRGEGFTSTTISSERVLAPAGVAGIPLIRCEVVNMTRHVHHHFDYAKDGHTRTYTMTVEANATATALATAAVGPLEKAAFRESTPTSPSDTGSRYLVGSSSFASPLSSSPPPLYRIPNGHHLTAAGTLVSVSMVRDKSTHVIPYNAIRAVTLIAVLRLGLVRSLKERAYKLFVKLPLFEDMAPWNIVFEGPRLDYIDYDTRDKTFDAEVQKTYQILSVLMNYKRTVTDFDRCGTKVGNPYNFPFVSECVKSTAFSGPCEDPAFPVACGDGHCRSDYITCLRFIVDGEEQDEAAASVIDGAETPTRKVDGRITWDFQ